jgi:hypothetical protein
VVSLVVHEVDFDIPRAVLTLPWHTGNPEDFDSGSLHYAHFPARVTLSVGEVTVMGPRTLVPFFDFLAQVARSVAPVRNGRPASIGFTECADRVGLRPAGTDHVDVVYSEALSRPGRIHHRERVTARAGREELVETFTTFLDSGRRLLIENCPGLERNPHMSKLSISSR